jgi:hypothetical protein
MGACSFQVLTWNLHHVEEHISSTTALVQEADELLKMVKGITSRAQRLAALWQDHSLFNHKEGQVGGKWAPETFLS